MHSPVSEYIATSVSVALRARLARTHRFRSIAVLSGPPGVGKSTSARRFVEEHPTEALYVSLPPGPKNGLTPVTAANLIIESILEGAGGWRQSDARSAYGRMRAAFRDAIAHAANMLGHADENWADPCKKPFTLVLDEAQNLSREAIEMLRYLNDQGSGWAPFPVGLAFLGNNEFALRSDASGQSVISAAVADRACYVEALTYQDVKPDDLKLYVEACLEIDEAALALAVAYLAQRPDRSIRVAQRLCIALQEEADAARHSTINRQHVAAVTGLTIMENAA